MKKLTTGICCGVVAVLLTAAVSSNTIQATLFPSMVTIHNGSQVTAIDGENEIINYNNKAYIPLRSFAEAMGADVNYQYASDQTNGRHLIDITPKPPLQWELSTWLASTASCYVTPFYIIPTIPKSGVENIDELPR